MLLPVKVQLLFLPIGAGLTKDNYDMLRSME